MSSELRIQGYEELLISLRQLGDRASLIEEQALIKASEPILEDIKTTVSFADRSGKLRRSLKMSPVKITRNGGRVIWIGDVDKQANYSWFVEFGHSNTPARPFMGPAFAKHHGEAMESIKDTFRRELGLT